MSKRPAKMEIVEAWVMGSPEYWWRMVGGNGQIIFVAETFQRRADAKRAMRRAIQIIQSGQFKVEE